MNIRQAFRDQAASCTRMGSPFMGRLLKILAEEWDEATALGQAMASYSGDVGPAGHSLPLRVAGGLHALVLSEKSEALARVYPPNDASDEALQREVLRALNTQEAFLLDWTKLPPQTNEIRRSAALIAMAHVALAHFDLPIVLYELGASGGLNLMWDRFALEIDGDTFGAPNPLVRLAPDWTGPKPPKAKPIINVRAGVDLNPLDPTDPAHRLRLGSYLWPDQPNRMEMLQNAAPHQKTRVEKKDAIDWLEDRLAETHRGHLHLVQHTVAWQYFPQNKQDRGRALLEAAGARASADAPLGWMQMETDGDRTGKVGAALTLRLWPGDITLNLGRADFHGRWIKWERP